MKDFYTDEEAFQKICGDCCGVEGITADDIISQAACWLDQGEDVSLSMVDAALRYLNTMEVRQ